MSYANYHCPICGIELPRELEIFIAHGERHVVEVVKKDHPDWIEPDGSSRRCEEYYHEQLSRLKR